MTTADEINAWLSDTEGDAVEIARRVYVLAQRCHPGERPKWLRNEWPQMPKDYRDFLASIALAAIDDYRSNGRAILKAEGMTP